MKFALFILLASALTTAALAADAIDAGVAKLIDRADHGDIAAARELGLRYRDGAGVPRDYAQALRWTLLAANQGDLAATDDLGYLYYQGWGVARNFETAVSYYKAASSKSAAAMFNLGNCYFGGQGVTQSLEQAVECWKQSANMGNPTAATYVAMAYCAGEGAPADRNQAMQWADKAVSLGAGSGLILRGELKFESGDIDAAKSDWEKAAELNKTTPASLHDTPKGADMLTLLPYRVAKRETGKFAFVQYTHIHQGYNNCGSTTSAMVFRFEGVPVTQYDVKRLCPASPIGTGTDWQDLVAAAGKKGLHWRIVTFTSDDAGLATGEAFVRSELDAGRPVIIDFTQSAPRLPSGQATHTLAIVGYIAQGNLFVLRDPAYSSPGLRIFTSEQLGNMWKSRAYSSAANGVISRPAIAVGDSRTMPVN